MSRFWCRREFSVTRTRPSTTSLAAGKPKRETNRRSKEMRVGISELRTEQVVKAMGETIFEMILPNSTLSDANSFGSSASTFGSKSLDDLDALHKNAVATNDPKLTAFASAYASLPNTDLAARMEAYNSAKEAVLKAALADVEMADEAEEEAAEDAIAIDPATEAPATTQSRDKIDDLD